MLSRATATQHPSTSPANNPSARLRFFRGVAGVSGVVAHRVTDTVTPETLSPGGVANAWIVTKDCRAISSAMSRARAGEISFTLRLMSTVSNGTATPTLLAKAWGLIVSLR